MRALFATLVLATFAQDSGVRELLRRLEDDSAESREKAQKELGALGEAALPDLREVIDSPSSSGELKLRASAAIRDIELAVKSAKVYREPKRLTLRADGTMLRETLDEIARQAGVAIDSAAVDGAARVTLDVKDATLMEVLYLLCRDQAERTWEAPEDGSIRMSRDRHVACPSVYSGPFRMRVGSMNAQRNNDFKARSVFLTLTLQGDWDKRIKPSRIVEIELAKALDNQGTALEIMPYDANMVFRGGPGMQLRVGVGMQQDAWDNSRVFTLRGVNPAAASVDLEGTARFSFPLDQREIKFEKPAVTETRDLGDTTVRLSHSGTPEIWNLSFHKAPSSNTPGWARTIGQRFDPDSFVVVDQDGGEFPASMRSANRGRAFQEAASEVGLWYQAIVQRAPGKAIKEVRFRFVDQTLVKSMPFKFTALALP
jgi:hypothetical protein